jgi:hypothetical protein
LGGGFSEIGEGQVALIQKAFEEMVITEPVTNSSSLLPMQKQKAATPCGGVQ